MLPAWYNEYKTLIDESIKKYLDTYFSEWNISKWLLEFKDAVCYSVKWWKKIRSILALEFYLMFSNKTIDDIKYWDDILYYCISLELLHAYSLVHDDLPCMDNDILRRWELTVWKKYWDDTATLVWDLLNSISFEIISNLSNDIDIRMLMSYYWKSVWFFGMVWWQILDLYFDEYHDDLDLNNLIEIHNKKTWALIESSVVWWIIIAKNENKINQYIDFWKKIWLAFQIRDDLLDVEWNIIETGKNIRNDNKWFVYLIWVGKSREYLSNLISESLDIIKPLKSEKLDFLVEYIGNRSK